MANPAFDLLFVDQVDRRTDENLVEEMFWSMIQRHPYYIHDIGSSTINLYGEPEGEPVYVQAPKLFPFHVKLDPEKGLLEKYGYYQPRDVLLFFSSKIQKQLGILPKVGDRFDFAYINTQGVTYVEHFEITESRFSEFARQTKVPYVVTAVAVKTHKRIQPPREATLATRSWLKLLDPSQITQLQIDSYEGIIARTTHVAAATYASVVGSALGPFSIDPGDDLQIWLDDVTISGGGTQIMTVDLPTLVGHTGSTTVAEIAAAVSAAAVSAGLPVQGFDSNNHVGIRVYGSGAQNKLLWVMDLSTAATKLGLDSLWHYAPSQGKPAMLSSQPSPFSLSEMQTLTLADFQHSVIPTVAFTEGSPPSTPGNVYDITAVSAGEVAEAMYNAWVAAGTPDYIPYRLAVPTLAGVIALFMLGRSGRVYDGTEWAQVTGGTANPVIGFPTAQANPIAAVGPNQVTVGVPSTADPGLHLYLFNDLSSTDDVIFIAGAFRIQLAPGAGRVVIWDGAAWMLQV